MKNKKTNEKKNIVITLLLIALIFSGLLNIFNAITENDSEKTMFYSASYISIQDGDFNKDYNFTYNSSYVKIELIQEKKELKITPVKTGDTTLKVDYITDSGENKTVSYEIDVRKGLSLEIKNK